MPLLKHAHHKQSLFPKIMQQVQNIEDTSILQVKPTLPTALYNLIIFFSESLLPDPVRTPGPVQPKKLGHNPVLPTPKPSEEA
jgi:hypothetical protein